MKAEKSEFQRSTVAFLGYVIAEGNVQMDPVKVKAVLDGLQPTSRVQLQRFLGFANFYCRFIRGYNSLAPPPSRHSLLPKYRSNGLLLSKKPLWT